MNSSSIAQLGWHFDLHTPGYVRVNHKPDPGGLAMRLKAAGVDEIITFAKCHYGFAYYPTKVGTPHPRMKGDAFGSVIRACRKTGLAVLAYISFGIDGQAGKRHPEWQQRGKDRRGFPPGYGFISVCPFTSYLDELMLPQIAEVIKLYHPDGFWFDTMSALAPCFCTRCRASFRKATGKEVPTEDSDPLQATYGGWRHDRGVAMVERVCNFIHQRLPGATVSFNQLGSLTYPEPLPKGVTVLSLDPPTYGPQSVQFSLNAMFGAATGQPCEVMPTIFNQGWGDWSPATGLRWETVAVSVWARGVRLFMGDRLHPQIRLSEVSRQALESVGRLRKRVIAEFPSSDAMPAPDVLIVHSPCVTYGDQYEDFARRPRERLRRVSGAQELCLDSGLNYIVTPEAHLGKNLERARLVLLPELMTLARETEAMLRNHVANGGRLLIAGPIPAVDGRPLDWVGVRLDSQPWQDHVYLPAWEDGGELPTLVRGDFHRSKLNGAESVLQAIPAYDAKHGDRYGWGIGPASDKPSSHAVLTQHRYGKGSIWHLGVRIFTDYATHANWQQRTWFLRLTQEIKAAYCAWLDSPHGKVELVLWENESSTWAILIQHGSEQLCGTYGTPLPWTRTLGPTPQSDLVLHLERRHGTPVRVVSGGKKLPWTKRGRRVQVPVSLKTIWSVICVDWNGAGESMRRGPTHEI